jgi:hypothetical protein
MSDVFRSVPGVISVGGSSTRAIDAFVRPRFDVITERRTLPAVFSTMVTPGYFQTMGTPFSRGRDLDNTDRLESPWVAIVNDAAAEQLWPGDDPLGKILRLDTVPDDRARVVVGVVRNIPLGNAAVMPEPIVYTSHLQQPPRFIAPWINLFGTMTFVVRYHGVRPEIGAELRRAAAAVEPDVPLAGLSLVRERLAAGRYRLIGLSRVAVLLAAAAMLLAVVGVYGVVAFGVRRQSVEIAVRRTLGARAIDVVRLVASRLVSMIAIGVSAGVLGAVLLGQGLRSYLWGISVVDPLTYALAGIAIIGVTAVGSLAPLKQALNVAPSSALR